MAPTEAGNRLRKDLNELFTESVYKQIIVSTEKVLANIEEKPDDCKVFSTALRVMNSTVEMSKLLGSINGLKLLSFGFLCKNAFSEVHGNATVNHSAHCEYLKSEQ